MRLPVLLLLAYIWSIDLASAQKTIWKADDLHRVEINSWFDLFSLSPNWINATNDDASFQHSRNGLAGLGGAWWPVYVNGTKLNTQSWDVQSLHLIPFTISQLDSAVMVEQPVLYEGVFTEKGAVFLYTGETKKGWGVQGNLSFGNKSGDPGPFVYTELVTPNIERVGPVADGQISYRAQNFGVKASGALFYHALTDNLLQYRRLIPFEFGGEEYKYRQVKIISHSGFVEADYTNAGFRHHIQAGASKAEDYLFADIYGVEIPVERSLGFAAVQGAGEIFEDIGFSYQISHNSHHTESFSNKDDRWLNWKQQTSEIENAITHRYDKGYQEIGFAAEFLNLNDELNNQDLTTQLFSLHHKVRYRFLHWLSLHSNLKLVTAEEPVLKQNVGFEFHLSKTNRLLLQSTYSERLPAEDNSLWYWVSQHGFAGDTLAEFDFGELPARSKFIKSSLGWNTSIPEKGTFSAALEFIQHLDEYLFAVQIVSNGNSTETGEVDFLSDLDASFIRIPVKLEVEVIPNLFQAAGYTWNQQQSGSEDFHSMVPAHRFTYTINWKPVQSFKVWSRIQAQSETSWNALQALNGRVVISRRLGGEVSDTYYSDSAARFLWDVGIKKYFWNQRIDVSMDLRNITDQHFRYHPLSEMHRFTLFLKASLRLP